MKKNLSMKLLAGAVFLSGVFVGLPRASLAQIYEPTPEFEKEIRPPLNLQGQLVTLRIVPFAKKANVYVTGVPANQLFQPEIGLKAFTRSEGEVVPVTSLRDGDYFVVETPVYENGVKLDIDVNGRVESFSVDPARNWDGAVPSISGRSPR